MAPDRSWAPWGAGIIIALLGTAALSTFALSGPEEDRGTATQVTSGAACDELTAVAAALRSGRRDRLSATLSAAADAAIESLQRSDLRFGAPEKVALKIESIRLEEKLSRRARQRVEHRLKVAEQACSRLTS